MLESPNVRMFLVSRPENVVLIREVLSGLAAGLDMGGTVEDVKAAVSEAANNVVIHAYPDGEGPMEVEIALAGRWLDVVVRDHGIGIGPRIVDENHPGRGIGLAVIEALASRCELRVHDQGPGVEVAMRFEVPEQPELRGVDLAQQGAPQEQSNREPDALQIVVAPPALSGSVFDRVVTGLAARAGFSIDRLSDVQLITDALTARIASALAGDHVRLVAAVRNRGLELRVAPLHAGGSERLVGGSELAEIGPIIARLADEVVTHHEADGEVLALTIRDPREAGGIPSGR